MFCVTACCSCSCIHPQKMLHILMMMLLLLLLLLLSKFICLLQPGCGTAVLFDWKGEDSGPNVESAADVQALYAQARAQYPGATVVSGGLDDVAAALNSPECLAELPVLTKEVGDTWV